MLDEKERRARGDECAGGKGDGKVTQARGTRAYTWAHKTLDARLKVAAF